MKYKIGDLFTFKTDEHTMWELVDYDKSKHLYMLQIVDPFNDKSIFINYEDFEKHFNLEVLC